MSNPLAIPDSWDLVVSPGRQKLVMVANLGCGRRPMVAAAGESREPRPREPLQG